MGAAFVVGASWEFFPLGTTTVRSRYGLFCERYSLGDVLVEQDDVFSVGDPERIAVGALHDVPGIAVRMHVDLDAGAVVADGTVHRVFLS